MDVFQALFKGVSTIFGLRIVEKCLENAFEKDGTGLPTSSFGEHKMICWNNEQSVACVCARSTERTARGG